LSTKLGRYTDAFLCGATIAIVANFFFVRTFFIPSASMEPTLQIGDVLAVNVLSYRFGQPHEGDIVVFKPPIAGNRDFIKRIVGLPGDTIAIHNGFVYRNDQILNEPYIAQRPNYELTLHDWGIYVNGVRLSNQTANIPPREKWQAATTVPAGCYLLLGDNRNDSDDSHIWGFAQLSGNFYREGQTEQKAEFTGRAFIIFLPLSHFRFLPR
jgi:signal peptidase I